MATRGLVQAVKDLTEVVRLSGAPIKDPFRYEVHLPGSHNPDLPEGSRAVYAFLCGDTSLKVGKVGLRSAARFEYQHYQGGAQSTLHASLTTEVMALRLSARGVQIDRVLTEEGEAVYRAPHAEVRPTVPNLDRTSPEKDRPNLDRSLISVSAAAIKHVHDRVFAESPFEPHDLARLDERFGIGDRRAAPVQTVEQWIRGRTERIDIFVPAALGPAMASLVEAFLHARWSPRYEGRTRI